ncbi:Hypothetical predicted protein [Cloeon dipterum]|uniref:Uncharacterized protein n=1 Tax=Cloeon dipterum TaxID=197152 RepID=A0A8S1E5X5_9INSE|nr:Hypothetical predicted protein [Cloeon dipterum]
MLKESVDVLQPLHAFSSRLRSPKTPILISEYIPLLETIRTCITKVDVLCVGTLQLENNILGKISRAIDQMYRKKNVVKAMMLDCRFKQRLLTALQYSNTRQEILEEARAAEQSQSHQQFQDMHEADTDTREPLSLINAFGSPAFWSLHSSLLGTGVLDKVACTSRQNNSSDSSTKLQLSNFFQKPPNPNITGLDYWRIAHSSAISANVNCSQKGFQLKAISSLADSVWFDAHVTSKT